MDPQFSNRQVPRHFRTGEGGSQLSSQWVLLCPALFQSLSRQSDDPAQGELQDITCVVSRTRRILGVMWPHNENVNHHGLWFRWTYYFQHPKEPIYLDLFPFLFLGVLITLFCLFMYVCMYVFIYFNFISCSQLVPRGFLSVSNDSIGWRAH